MKRVLPLFLGLLYAPMANLIADGIPEPGIILYGNVTNANRLLRSGSLTVEFSGPSGKLVRVTTQLLAGGAYAYRLRVPFESLVGGNAQSTDSYSLTGQSVAVRLSSPAGYSPGSTNSFAASFSLANTVLTLPAGERGMVREVNFRVDATLPNSGPIRLAEARILPIKPEGEAGGTGVSEPVFQFSSISTTEQPGVLVEWIGAPANRGYYLLRSTEMETPVEQSEVVRYFPPSPQTANSHWDTNTVNTATYFYRIHVP